MTQAKEPRDADGQLHGLVVRLYPWGALDSEIEYVHGTMHGVAREYHANGTLKREGLHAAGYRHGTTRTYDDEGRLIEEAVYSRGDLDGRIVRYQTVDGAQVVTETVEMRADKRHGESRRFNERGVLTELVTYADDVMQGPCRRYWDDGLPLRFESWLDGSLHGLEMDFYVGGAKRHAGFRDRGRAHGPLLTYHDNGQVTGVSMYWEGEPTADLTLARPWLLQHAELLGISDVEALVAPEAGGAFYPNGQRKAEFAQVAGVREGPYRIFRIDGRVAEQGHYRAGKVDGEVRSFHDNDQPHMTVTFAAGQRHGSESEHDASGALLWQKEWRDGQPVAETTYYLNGHMQRELRRGADGEVNGTWYHDNGVMEYVGSMRVDPKRTASKRLEDELDLPTGVHRRYRRTGELTWEQAFEGGRPHGPCKVFDWEGRLVFEETYVDGVMTRRVTYEESGRLHSDEEFFADGSRKVTRSD